MGLTLLQPLMRMRRIKVISTILTPACQRKPKERTSLLVQVEEAEDHPNLEKGPIHDR